MDDRQLTVDATDEMDEEESPEIEVTRVEIEQTRAELSDTIDALKEKLSPQRLMEEAKESVHDATIGRVERAVGDAVDTTRDTLSDVGETAKGMGSMIVDTVRKNPLAASMVGIGAYMLYRSAQEQGPATYRGSGNYRTNEYGTGYAGPTPTGTRGVTDQAREAVGDVADRTREAVGDVADRTREAVGDVADRTREAVGTAAERTRETVGAVAGTVQDTAENIGSKARDLAQGTREGFQDMLQTNPLGVGAIALALGAAVGFTLPETRQENRLMGEARENLVEQVGQKAQDVAQKVQTVAKDTMSAATDTAKKEAADQGLAPQ